MVREVKPSHKLDIVEIQGVQVQACDCGSKVDVKVCALRGLFHTAKHTRNSIFICTLNASGDLSAAHMECSAQQGEACTQQCCGSGTGVATEVASPDPRIAQLCQEFKEVFAEPGLPPFREITHDITLQDEALVPPKPSVYRMSPAELAEVQKQIEVFLEKGWIRPSTSLYSTPNLFLRKADGSLRVCIEYRALNQQTKRGQYPIPRIDDLLDRLLTARFFSKIDLSQGYHQVGMTPGHEQKTAFISRYGLFEWTVLPIGLCNALSIFQGLMNRVFHNEMDRFVLVYLKDILVYSPTMDEHVAHLRIVLTRLREEKLLAKRKQCTFSVTRVNYLGHVVGNGEVKADDSKVSMVTTWPVPTCVKDVQQFLGFANYCNRYIPNFAMLALPLTDLLQNHVAFYWGEKQQQAFDALKSALTSTRVLALPKPALNYTIVTDASAFGVGATLQQEGRPVVYFSRKLNPAERNYNVHGLEFLAIFLACKRWRCYIHGSKTTVLTDHEPLVNVLTQPTLNSRQTRWVEQLAGLDLEIKYVPGVENVAADAFSRRPQVEADLHFFADSQVQQQVADWLVQVAPQFAVQQCVDAVAIALSGGVPLKPVRCEQCQKFALSVSNDARKKHLVHTCGLCSHVFKVQPVCACNPLVHFAPVLLHERLCLSRLLQVYPRAALAVLTVEPTFLQRISTATFDENDREMVSLVARARDAQDGKFYIAQQHGVQLVYRKHSESQPAIVIPSGGGLRRLLMQEAHYGAGGHFGTRKTAAYLYTRVWWPRLVPTVATFVRGCTSCQQNKDSTQVPQGLHQPVEIRPVGFHTYSMDSITYLPLYNGFNAIFTIVGKLTKFTRLIPCTLGEDQLTVQQVAQLFFDKIVRAFGLPQVVLHDRDVRFTANFWRELWRLYGIRVALTSAYHAQTDGQTERQHHTVEQVLRCMLAEQQLPQDQWCRLLSSVELAINSTVQDSTGYNPIFMVFGQQVVTPLNVMVGTESTVPAAVDFAAQIAHTVQAAQAQLNKADEYQHKYMGKHRRDVSFEVGDQVLLDSRHLQMPGSSKFRVGFVGPFSLVSRLGPVVYRVELPLRFSRVHPVFHVSLLRCYHVGGVGATPPEPITRSSVEMYFEVCMILGYWWRHGRLQYLTRFTGYDPSHDEWLSAEQLEDADEKLRSYREASGMTADQE